MTAVRPRRASPGPVPRTPPDARWWFALREFRFWLTDYRRTWRGSVISSVLEPLLYLGAMGVGLGTLVDRHPRVTLGGVSYLVFIAPGLLAATGMQTAFGEAMYPVLGSVKWNRNYLAAVVTPLRPRDVFRGHLLFVTARITMNAAVFLAAIAAFGVVRTPVAVLALPAAVLTGLTFAAWLMAWSITRATDVSFTALFRFGMVPLFLFSGTFFPIGQLPAWLRPVAYITPLWHGVQLCRSLVLGTATVDAIAVHAGYLVGVAGAGIVAGHVTYARRLHA